MLVLKTSRDTGSLHFREVTMSEVEVAARFANAHDFITSFREDVSISSELKSINKILAGVKYVRKRLEEPSPLQRWLRDPVRH